MVYNALHTAIVSYNCYRIILTILSNDKLIVPVYLGLLDDLGLLDQLDHLELQENMVLLVPLDLRVLLEFLEL